MKFVPRPFRRALFVAFATAAVALSILAVGGSPAQADPLAVIEGESLDVKADQLAVDVNNGTAVLTGHVTAALGDLEVSCPKVEIRYDKAPMVQWAKGSGGVRARLKGIEATASSVSVDVKKREVTLRGGVRLMRGKGWVEADRASIDLTTRKVTLHQVKGSIPVAPKR